MFNGISGTRLRRSIDRRSHKHSRPQIGDAECQDQKDWGEDGSLSHSGGFGVSEKMTKLMDHLVHLSLVESGID